MKNNLFLIAFLSFFLSNAQVGINTDSPKATLDIVGNPNLASQLDGIIAPRLSGDQLKAKTYSADQTGALIYATDAFTNTSTPQTVNVTSSGYYYFDGNVWNKIIGKDNVPVEPWNIQDTKNPSAQNTDNIYQMGSVAIKKIKARTDVDLDVLGSIRGAYAGKYPDYTDPIGFASVALGYSAEATNIYSIALGLYSKAYGPASVAIGSGIGLGTIAEGSNSVAIGYDAKAEGNQSLSLGVDSKAVGETSTAIGYNVTAASKNEISMGKYNAITKGSPTTIVATDALLQIGKGIGSGSNSENALTILKNGNTGIGISGVENNAKPTERLDIGSGKVKIREINTTIGTTSDRIVVAGADGVLKTIPNTTSKTTITNRVANNNIIPITNIAIISSAIGKYQLDLYTEYKKKINGNPTIVNNIIKSEGAPALMSTINNDSFYYYITAYDPNVISNLSIDTNGVLSYSIKNTSKATSNINVTLVQK